MKVTKCIWLLNKLKLQACSSKWWKPRTLASGKSLLRVDKKKLQETTNGSPYNNTLPHRFALRYATGWIKQSRKLDVHRQYSANTWQLFTISEKWNLHVSFKQIKILLHRLSCQENQIFIQKIFRSTTCDGICSLPDGYSSKCEQQYVQKRLVALEGSGDRLYTDVFWIPHGCSCQITPNF